MLKGCVPAHVLRKQNQRSEKTIDAHAWGAALYIAGNEGVRVMPPPLSRLMNHLRRSALQGATETVGDDELLKRFVAERDPLAFELLLRRHGPMVLGVCQRVIGNSHDAEDAFQATFLVLVRKAARIRPPRAVGSWLYGVAYRTALGARSRLARRRAREVSMASLPACIAKTEEMWSDLRAVLDRELNVLPEKYRLPIVLCDLEGRGRKEVAHTLAIPEGTVSSRLATGRRLLAARLTRRGVTLSGSALAVLLAQSSASAVVPTTLWLSTTQSALLFAAGPTAAAGIVPGPVVALTEGMLRMMFAAKIKMAAVVVVGVTALCLGTGGIVYEVRAGIGQPDQGQPPSQQTAHHDANAKEGHAQQSQHDTDSLRRRVADLRQALEDARARAKAARDQVAVAQAMQAQAEAQLRQAEERLRQVEPESPAKPRVGRQAGSPRARFPITMERRLQLLEDQIRQRDAAQQARLDQLQAQLNSLLAGQGKRAGQQPRNASELPSGEQTFILHCKYALASDAASTLRRLMPATSFGVDERTNALIMTGSANTYQTVKNLLAAIDVPGRKAQPTVSGDKLDRILERLDHIEHRLDHLEPHQPSQRQVKPE
jgi:RNA polymerase sigma factor (sigma-70 family)